MVSKKCSIGILQIEVGLEAGYNLLPVMEDKNLLAMNTQYLYTVVLEKVPSEGS